MPYIVLTLNSDLFCTILTILVFFRDKFCLLQVQEGITFQSFSPFEVSGWDANIYNTFNEINTRFTLGWVLLWLDSYNVLFSDTNTSKAYLKYANQNE